MRLFILLFITCLIACQSNTTQQAPEVDQPSITIEPEETALTETYCFVLSYGVDPKYQDTTTANLTIVGSNVTGTYDWIPAEKDSARGVLTGTKNGDIITAIYDYVIEGSKQREEKIFKMEVNQLLVKRGELHEVDGVLKLKNPEIAKFSEIIPRVICK